MYYNPNDDTYAAFATVSGGAIMEMVIPLLTGTNSEIDPGVGWNGAQFMVAYDSYNRTTLAKRYLQLAGANGAASGGPIGPLTDSEVGTDTLVLWNGQTYLVAAVAGSGFDLSFYRVSSTGTQLDTKPSLVPATVDASLSNLQGIALGGKFVLVVQDTPIDAFGAPLGTDNIDGLVVNADGTSAAKTTPIAAGNGMQDVPAVATDGTSALVIWRDRGGSVPSLVGTRLDATLTRLDAADVAIAQATSPTTMGAPALAWTVTFDSCLLGSDLHCPPARRRVHDRNRHRDGAALRARRRRGRQ